MYAKKNILIIILIKYILVHFNDYNPEVLEEITIPNLLLNLHIPDKHQSRTR